jgi:hypothetical protein
VAEETLGVSVPEREGDLLRIQTSLRKLWTRVESGAMLEGMCLVPEVTRTVIRASLMISHCLTFLNFPRQGNLMSSQRKRALCLLL